MPRSCHALAVALPLPLFSFPSGFFFFFFFFLLTTRAFTAHNARMAAQQHSLAAGLAVHKRGGPVAALCSRLAYGSAVHRQTRPTTGHHDSDELGRGPSTHLATVPAHPYLVHTTLHTPPPLHCLAIPHVPLVARARQSAMRNNMALAISCVQRVAATRARTHAARARAHTPPTAFSAGENRSRALQHGAGSLLCCHYTTA